MPTKRLEQESGANSTDWLDLDLPVVTGDSAPVDHPLPSSVLAFRHSWELLRGIPEATWKRRREEMNPTRFEFAASQR